MNSFLQWLLDNWQAVLAFVSTGLAQAFFVIKRFWGIERDIKELQRQLETQKENHNSQMADIKEELKEIRDDIKKLLSR